MKFISIIVAVLLLPALLLAECTTPEAIEKGLNLVESILVLCGFGVTGGAAVLIKSIMTGRKALAAVMQSLDENDRVDNFKLLTKAGEQGNAEAVRQFIKLAGTKPNQGK